MEDAAAANPAHLVGARCARPKIMQVESRGYQNGVTRDDAVTIVDGNNIALCSTAARDCPRGTGKHISVADSGGPTEDRINFVAIQAQVSEESFDVALIVRLDDGNDNWRLAWNGHGQNIQRMCPYRPREPGAAGITNRYPDRSHRNTSPDRYGRGR